MGDRTMQLNYGWGGVNVQEGNSFQTGLQRYNRCILAVRDLDEVSKGVVLNPIATPVFVLRRYK